MTFFSHFVSRRRHSEREDLQAVYEEAAGGSETENPSGQWAQVHVHFPSPAHFLFPLQRVHLVSRSRTNHCYLHVFCVDCKLDLIVSLFLYIGVFLESRVINAKVSKPYFLSPINTICKHTDINCGLDIEQLLFQFVRVWFTNDAISMLSLCVHG